MTNSAPSAVEQLARLSAGSFSTCAAAMWRIYDKAGKSVPFVLNSAQKMAQTVVDRQMAEGRPVRVRILKGRQCGISTWASSLMLHSTMFGEGRIALSIADKAELTSQWLRRCRSLHQQTPRQIRVSAGATNANELWFDGIGSRYYIGSAEGKTPGMGAVLQYVHCSELASWLNPDSVLADLLPAVPQGPGTMVIQESTGRTVGDWWYQRWHESKRGESDYEPLFVSWLAVDEYRRPQDVDDITALTDEEQLIVRCGADKAQLAWRRWVLQNDFHGDKALFANQFPATETEAFLSGGVNVFTPEQVIEARKTVRGPQWRGDVLVVGNPRDYRLNENPSGPLLIWERPDSRHHYVLGADCQWGTSDGADYDSMFVECLDTGKKVARLKGRFDLYDWGKKIAAMGYLYNACPVAPERNGAPGSAVVALLCGNLSDWRYPNVWIRSDDVKLKGHRPEDYGWLTTEHSKNEIVQYAKAATLAGDYDWADAESVDQMAAYIVDDKGKMTAPEGQHDDDLMASMITTYLAHRLRPITSLYAEPVPMRVQLTPPWARVMASIARDDDGADRYGDDYIES